MKNRSGIAEMIAEVDRDWANDRRKEFLMQRMTGRVTEALELLNKYQEYKAARKTLDMMLIGERIEEVTKLIQADKDELWFMRHPRNKDEITPAMIEQAKAYPMDRLIEFKNKSAMCPFHDGRTPALRYYPESNTAWCFACQKHWDSIEWLKDKEGLSFKDAVRRLQ